MIECLHPGDGEFVLYESEESADPEGVLATAFYMGRDRNTGTEKRGSEFKDDPKRKIPPQQKPLFPEPQKQKGPPTR